MNRPRLVTITGIDVHTDLGRAGDLCERYPLEFALLGDPGREGTGQRVPDPAFATELARHFSPGQLALHLCGGYATQALAREFEALEARFSLSRFRRIQVNAPATTERQRAALNELGEFSGCAIIVQNTARVIPYVPGLLFLDDRSAGRGRLPEQRAAPDARYTSDDDLTPVGYAGGLTPQNLAAQLQAINKVNPTAPFWIDVASGVRDDADLLDLEAVERFLATALDDA